MQEAGARQTNGRRGEADAPEGVELAPRLRRWLAYRIRPDAAADFFRISRTARDQRGDSPIAYVPNVDDVTLILAPKRAVAAGFLSCAEARIEPMPAFGALWVRFRSLWLRKKNIVDFGDFRIFILGPKRFRRVLISAIRYLQKLGTPLEGETIRQRPELLLGWEPGGVSLPPFFGEPRRTKSKVAVVLHLFYADLWPEIRTVLKSLPLAFDLIVTTVPERDALVEAIRADFPSATIRVVENRGRDVRPFLLLLEEGALDAYDCVCKIHGKKSLHGLKRNPYGEIWRRRLLFDLLCAEGTMAAAVERFEREPGLGLLGPEAFRVAGAEIADFYWRKNWERVAWLLERLGIDPARVEPDFFAGTMFWVRPKALAPLRKLVLSRDFEPDRGRTDGALEHAVERVLTIAVKTAGYEIQEINGLRI